MHERFEPGVKWEVQAWVREGVKALPHNLWF